MQRDVTAILRYYDRVSGRLADAFWEELIACIHATAQHPEFSHFTDLGLRRVNLRRFPYHFLFRELSGKIRITVVRHNKRRPEYGIWRR